MLQIATAITLLIAVKEGTVYCSVSTIVNHLHVVHAKIIIMFLFVMNYLTAYNSLIRNTEELVFMDTYCAPYV